MHTPFLKVTVASLLMSFALATGSIAATRLHFPAADVFEGPPTSGLPASTYAPVNVKRLAHAKILWVNYDMLRELGYTIPEGGLTPELERELLDHFAYAVDDGKRPASSFLDRIRQFFADRYGGRGMNGNLGSGRAGSTGKFNIKGIGGTSMIGPGADETHSTGRVGASESAREAMWSTLFDRELPHGSVRSFMVISTGEKHFAQFLSEEDAAALHVRQDPVRPAHFMKNLHAEGESRALDEKRLSESLALLPEHMSHPKDYIERVAEQYAFTDANRFYQGVASASNIGIDGKVLDLGSFALLEGYPPVNFADLKPFGSPEPVQKEMVWEFFKELQGKLPPEYAATLPSPQETWDMYGKHYRSRFAVEMVQQTGAPAAWIEKNAQDRKVQRLGAILRELAFTGPKEEIGIYAEIPGKIMRFDPRALLELLGSKPSLSVKERDLLLKSQVADPRLRRELVASYSDFLDLMKKEAKAAGLPTANFESFIRESSAARNRERFALYRRPPQVREFQDAVNKAASGESPQALQGLIDETVTHEQRVYRDIEPLQVVLSEEKDPIRGLSLRRIYDAAQNEYRSIVRVHAPKGGVSFLGPVFNVDGIQATGQARGDYFEYSFPDLGEKRGIRTLMGTDAVSECLRAFRAVGRK